MHLLQNEATVARLPEPFRSRAIILNHGLLADVHPSPPRARAPYCLYVGALESRKGPGLAVRALAYTPEDVRLVVVGDGPERRTLEGLGRRLGVAHRLELRGARPRSEVQELFSEAAVAVFTGISALLAVLAYFDSLGLAAFMILLGGIMFLVGMIFSNFNALAMEPQGHIAGTASSLFGSITTLIAASIGSIVGQAYDGTLAPLSTGFLVLGLVTLGIIAVTEKGRFFVKAD